MTKCPRCVQRIHRSAAGCPHCGFDMKDVDLLFGGDDVRLAALSDAAGVLRAKERKEMRLMMNEFERRFPQLFFSIYIGAFEEVSHLRQFGFWLLNRGAFVDVEMSRPNECGVLLSIDVSGKAAGLTYGYALHPFLDEDDTFAALSVGHPLFLQGQYFKGIEIVLKKVESTLVRRSKRAKKDPAKYQDEQPTEGTGELLERIRSRHRQKERKL
ncbi:MAG: hypothetical protein ACSHYB_08405 [Roseibacillus sp.]